METPDGTYQCGTRPGLLAIIGLVPEIPRTAAETDLAMMRRALLAAEEAAGRGEVPVGAVVARGDEVLAVAANEREATGDATATADLPATREAANTLGGWRLAGCTLYATLEPCPMCAGAAHAARLDRLVYAAPAPKAGYAGTLPAHTRDPAAPPPPPPARPVYAAPDPKAGYAGTLHDVTRDPRLNHTLTVRSGLLEKEAADLLRSFFKARRKRAPKPQDPPQIPG